MVTFISGDCVQPGLPPIDMTILEPLNLMGPSAVNAWMWVYLVVSILWLISSITLIAGNITYMYEIT